jgi:putative DNA primase/helicase
MRRFYVGDVLICPPDPTVEQVESIPLQEEVQRETDDWLSELSPNEEQDLEQEVATEHEQEARKYLRSNEPLTDTFNANYLIMRYGNEWKHASEKGGEKFEGWHRWNGKIWVEDKGKRIKQVAQRVAKDFRSLTRDAVRDDTRRQKLSEHGTKSESYNGLLNMVRIANSDLSIQTSINDFDKNPDLLCLKNTTIDLSTSESIGFRKSDLITKQMNLDYDPEAQCPTWLEFLDYFMHGDQDLIEYLQKLAGYCLTGNIGERKFFILYGKGRNGKTQFTTVLQALLGSYCGSLNVRTITDTQYDEIPTDLAGQTGKRLVLVSETPEGMRLKENMVKALTGGGSNKIKRVRFMRQDYFDMIVSFKLLIETNDLPEIVKERNLAIWDRLVLIPFTVRIPESEKIDDYAEKHLFCELPGILNWALEGCQIWQQEGLGSCEAIDEAVKTYKQESNTVEGFFDSEVERYNEGYSISGRALHRAYGSWCDFNDLPAKTEREFLKLVRDMGIKKERKREFNVYDVKLIERGEDR